MRFEKVKLKTLSIILLILSGIYIFFWFVIDIAEGQRLHFGDKDGNALLCIEILLCAYIAYRLWKKGKRRREVIAETWFVAALLFFFLGWFMHPDKVYKRATDRITYWRSWQKTNWAYEREELFQAELSARELEYQAAKIRYNQGIPPMLTTWALYIGGAIFVVNGIITLLAKRKSGAEAYYNLGREYFALGRDEDAIEALKQVIRINPDNAKVRFHLALVYLLLGDKGSALEEYKILKDLNKDLANELFDEIYRSVGKLPSESAK